MNALLLAPHNDDETLFAAFSIMRSKPLVVVVLRSVLQERRGTGIVAGQRERETTAALAALGHDHWVQWEFPDDEPPWGEIHERVGMLRDGNSEYDVCYAPAVEDGGHDHHNRVGEIAQDVFGPDVIPYLTYTNGRERSRGVAVPYEPLWPARKLRALACYESQIAEPSTGHHFLADQNEWYQ